MEKNKEITVGSVEWVCKQARKAGLSYGAYTALYNIPSRPSAFSPPELGTHQKVYSPSEKERLKEWGNKVRAVREAKGLTQEEIAEAIGVHPQAVQRWERGVNRPSEANLDKLCSLYGVDLRDGMI